METSDRAEVDKLHAALKDVDPSVAMAYYVSARGGADADLMAPPPPPNGNSRPRSARNRAVRGAATSTACGSRTRSPPRSRATGIKPGTWYEYGRHTFGSLSGLGEISTWRFKEIMGHQDISTTERYVSLKGQDLTPAELTALGVYA